jgi:hypothetical protein
MKRLLVTYKVKDAHWWIVNNTLKQVGEPMGIKFHIFRKAHTNLVGYIAEIPDIDVLDKILLNTTILSDSFKANGVILETIEMFEEVEN